MDSLSNQLQAQRRILVSIGIDLEVNSLLISSTVCIICRNEINFCMCEVGVISLESKTDENKPGR